MAGYEGWRGILSTEEGVGDYGYYGIYRDSEGYPTTGHGVRLTEDEATSFGGVGSQAPKDWVDSQSDSRQSGAWDNANRYMSESGIPDDPGARNAIASMFYQLGPGWHKDHKKTDEYLKSGRYEDAAYEVWDSKWATQTPKRVRTASDAFARMAGVDPLPSSLGSGGSYAGLMGDPAAAALAGDPVAREMMSEVSGVDYSPLTRAIDSISQIDEPEEVAYRDIELPDGTIAEVHPDVTDADALRQFKESNPEHFADPLPLMPRGDGDSNVFEAFGSGATRSTLGLWPGAQAFLASITGDEEGYDAAQSELAEISEKARNIAPDLVTTQEIGEVYDNEGLIPAIAKSVEFGAEQIFTSFGFQAPALAMAGVAAGVASVAGVPIASAAMVAGAAMMFANYLSEDIERGYEEGKVDTGDVEILKLITAAGGQAALDSLSYMLAGGTALLSAGGKRAFWSSTSKFLNELDKLSPAKRMLATIAEEEVAEVGQQALERFSAGLPVSPTDEDAAREYVQIMLATLAPSMGFSGMGSASSAWTKTKARRAEQGLQKARGELVETVRAMDSLARDTNGAKVEAQAEEVESQREELALRTREEGVVTPLDIRNVSGDRNIASDDAGFLSFVNRLFGNNLYHLEDLSSDKLQVVYDRISSMPVQDIKTSLQIAPDEKARALARSDKFKGKKPVTVSSVKGALGINETVDRKTADALAQGYIDKMTSLGLVRVNSKGKNVISRVNAGVKPDKYNRIIARVRETGSFPTRLEMEREFRVRNSDAYDSILSKALMQGEVEQSGKKYVAKALSVGTSGGFRVEVDGVVEGPVYGTEAEAEAAADSQYDADNKSWDANRRLNDRLRVPDSMRPVRKVGDVRIVEESGIRGSEPVEHFDHRVEEAAGKRTKSNRGGRWVVRDLAGGIVKHFKTAVEAKAFKKRRDKNAYHFEVEVDGEVISQHKTEKEANRAMQKWRKDEATKVEDSILQENAPNTGLGTEEISGRIDEAVDRGKAASRNAARRRKLKKRKVPEGSNLNEPSLEDGFVILEDRVAEDGKKSSAPVGFYETEAEALRASRDLKKKRVGRESFAGKIARRGSAKANEEMRAKRADPQAWAADQIPMPEVEVEARAEWLNKLQNKLEEILRARGLTEFRINLVDGLDLSTDLSVKALFVPSSNTIELALSVDLEGMSLDDQVRKLAPFLRHETLHGLRRLALIKPGEWAHLVKWVERTPIPKSRLDVLNSGRSDPFPEGTTYLQYAQIVYGNEGSRINEKAELSGRKDRGEISEDQFKAELAKIEESEWIADDYHEEAVAAAIEDWPELRPGDPKPGKVRAILRNIAKVIRRIGSALNGMGFNTQQDVIERVYGGNFADRVARDKSFDVWYTRKGRDSSRAELFEAKGLADAELGRLQAEKKSREAVAKALKDGSTVEEAEAAGAAAIEDVEGSELDPEMLAELEKSGTRAALRPQIVVQDDGVHEPIDRNGVSHISRPSKSFSEYREDHPGMLSHEEWVNSEKVKNRNIVDKGGALSLFNLAPGVLVDARLDLTNLVPIEGETIPDSSGEQVPLKGFVAQVHDMKPGDGGRHSLDGRDAKQSGRGPGIAYYPVIVLDNATFETDAVGQQRIAKGKSQKFPHSSVRGNVSPMMVEDVDYSGLEVTYNPRDSHLYVTVDGRKLAVKSAERAVIADGNQNPDAPSGAVIPQNARVILQGRVEFWKEGEAPSLPDGAVESNAEFFDSNIGVRRARVPRSDSSQHLMNVRREKKSIGVARWAKGERERIAKQAKEHGISERDIVAYVTGRKRAHAATGGWVPWVYDKTTIDKGKVSHVPVKIAYSFQRNKKGKILTGGARTRAVNSLARKMVDELLVVQTRAQSGDPQAETIINQSRWYKEMRRRIRSEFGGFGDLFADLLGATSPNTPVKMNWESAIEALRLASRGDYDGMISGWESWLESIEAEEQSLLQWIEDQLAEGAAERADLRAAFDVKVSKLNNQSISQIKKSKEGSERWSEVAKLSKKDHPAERDLANARYETWEKSQRIKGKKAKAALLSQLREDMALIEKASKSGIRGSHEFKRRKKALNKLRILPGSLSPRKENGARFGINSAHVAKTMVHLWRVIKAQSIIDGATAPKALNFSGNLIGFRSKATIDVWAARLLQRLAHGNRIPSQAEGAVGGTMLPSGETTGQFRFGQDVFTEAVDRIRNHPVLSGDPELSQISDDDLQAIVWFIEKERWAKDDTTSAEGEGGSFEYWANLEGSANRDRIQELNKIIVGKNYSEDEKAAAIEEVDSLQRVVDRYVGGASLERYDDVKDEAYEEWLPWAMATVAENIKSAVYEGDPDATILASKVATTEGNYGGPETAFDIEFVTRFGFDARSLWRKMAELGKEADQESVFLSRSLRDDEVIDPLVHRPGIEIYFREPLVAGGDSGISETLDRIFKGSGYTVIVDSRQDTGTLAGEMPRVVGARSQYVPEFGDSGQVENMSDSEIRDHIRSKAEEYQDMVSDSISGLPLVSGANIVWYDTNVAFRHEYDSILEEDLDGDGGRVQGEGIGQTRGEEWGGRSVREGAQAAERQREIGEGLEVESVSLGDAGTRAARRPTGRERGGESSWRGEEHYENLGRLGLLGRDGRLELPGDTEGSSVRLEDLHNGVRNSEESMRSVYRALGLRAKPGKDTNSDLRIYNLAKAFGKTVEDIEAALSGWLDRIGFEYRVFGPKAGENGQPVWPRFVDPKTGEIDPDTATYEDGVVWIFDPSDERGSLKDYGYTLPWRVTHEVAHALTNDLMTKKYGGRGRRSGALGVLVKGPFHKTDEVRSLADAMRAVEWEAMTFEVQRKILEEEFGVKIIDAEFNAENSFNLADAVYRAITGQFGDPGDVGILPTGNDPSVMLNNAMDILRQVALETTGEVSESFDQSLGGTRRARRPSGGSFEQDRAARGMDRARSTPRRDPRWAASIVRSQRPVVELPHDIYDALEKPGEKNNISWGWLHWDTKGQPPKDGRPTRAVVTRGYHQDTGVYNGVKANRTGIGARHAEFHDADLKKHTPYDNWKDMLSDFFRVVAATNKRMSTGYIYPVVNGNYASFLWDDPKFTHPITVVFSGEVIGNTELFMFVTAYPSARYDTYSGSNDQARAITPVHGPSMDAKTMKTYLRPAVAKAFAERSKIRPGDRRSLVPDSSSKAPEVIRMGDNLWGARKSRRDGRTFWNHVSSGWDYFNSEEWRDSVRSKYLDKYRAIYRQGKRVGIKRMDAAVGTLADTSAHAAALMADRAGGFLSAAFKYGIVTYKDGITSVEDLQLENTVTGTFYDPVNQVLVRRVVSHNVYEDGETGGLIPILNPASSPEKNLVDELFIYTAALRSFRLKNERGIDPPMSNRDIIDGLQLADKHPELAVIHANMQKWNNGTVEFLISTGVITREMGDVWMESADYLPFYLNLEGETTGMQQRVIESVLGDKVDYMMIGSLVGAKPPKKISGMSAKQQIIEPIEAISLNTMAAITAGLNNVAVQRSVRDALLLGNGQAVQVPDSEGDDVITVRMKGKEMHFRLADPLLHHALVGTLEGSNPLIDMLGGPARMLREVVTRSPEFMVANMLRDSLSVWTINGGQFPPVTKTFGQFGKNLKQWSVGSVNPEYKKLEMGGAIGGYDLGGTTPRHLKRFFARKIKGNKTALSPITKVWDGLGEASARSESATRELVYNQTYDRVFRDLQSSWSDDGSLTPEQKSKRVETASRKAQGEASFQAMEVLNFSRRGNSVWLKFVTATVPFLNARLQGIDVMVRSMTGEHAQLPGSRDRILTSIAARAALLSSFTFLYAVLMHDDEEYQNLRPEIKDDYWHIPIPGGGFISIPIPFEAGVLFKVLPQKMAELMLGGTTRDAANSIRHAAISTLNFNPIPQAVKPILEVATNHNFFTGRPLVPFYMENMDDAYKRRDSTNTVATMLGGETAQAVTLGASPSPLGWENLLRGYLGGMGMMTASILDSVFRAVSPSLPGKPWPRATDMIFADRFYRDEFGGGNKAGYYELRNEINGIVTTVNAMAKTDPRKAAKYQRDNSAVLRLKSTIRTIDKQMKLIREQRTRVFLSRSMDSSSKRVQLDALDRRENTLLRVVPSLRRSAYMNIEY